MSWVLTGVVVLFGVAVLIGCLVALLRPTWENHNGTERLKKSIARLRVDQRLHGAGRALLSRRNSRKPKEPDFSHLPEIFVVADVETTGLDPDNHEIIEISAIRAHRDAHIHETFTSLIRCKRRIPEKITQLTGISQDMVDSEGNALETIIPQFLDFIGGYRLVFYNAPFDVPFLQKAAARVGRTLTNPISDALAMARRAWPGLSSYKLTALAQAGGLDTTGAHRALHDCLMTLTVYTSASCLLKRVS